MLESLSPVEAELSEQIPSSPPGEAGDSTDPGCCGATGSGRVISLCCMLAGECGIIRQNLASGADAAYLRALGLRVNQRVRLCRAAGSWIVEVGCQGGPACRIGLARDMAEQVRVEVAVPKSEPGAGAAAGN